MCFGYRARIQLNYPSTKGIVTRWETDFNSALYGALISCCWGPIGTGGYLNLCWKELFCGEPPSPQNLHICDLHSSNFTTEYLKDAANYDAGTPTDYWRTKAIMDLYLKSTSMTEVVYYVQKMFRIFLSPVITDQIADDLNGCFTPMPVSYIHCWYVSQGHG